MQKTSTPSKSSGDKIGSRGFLSEATSKRSFSRPANPRAIILTCAILWSCFLQVSFSNSSQTKKSILIDSIFTQPDKLQLRFYPDLLVDIVQLHEQHLYKLDKMIKDIGNEIKKLKVQAGFHFSIDRAISQVISDTNKLWSVIAIFEWVIHSAFDKKLAPGALSIDVLEKIVRHIKDTAANNKFQNFIHQPSDLYQQETSFIHRPKENMVVLILHVPYV
jgi:hypothetical protein